MGNIKLLTPPEPNQELIDTLENMLTDVRNGEILGLVAVSQDKSGAAYFACHGIKDRWHVLGFLSHLMFKLQKDPEK